jgi:hypothetical protein
MRGSGPLLGSRTIACQDSNSSHRSGESSGLRGSLVFQQELCEAITESLRNRGQSALVTPREVRLGCG